MMTRILPALLMTFLLCSFKADKPAYQLFSGKGKTLTYENMLKQLAQADVVFFGEQHNDPIAHWLELELAKDLHKLHGKSLVIGTEMWETDTQTAIDSFLLGKSEEKAFVERSRVWPNYATDYKPVLLFAQKQNLKVIATNAPRRSARVVAREGMKGLSVLPDQEKQWLAPLPITVDLELPGYKNMLSMFGGNTHGNTAASTQIVEAQALKDATMAYFISKNLQKGQHLFHLNGAYHSDNHEGILWYLHRLRPELKVMTISTVMQPELLQLAKEHLNRADVVLVVPESMTRTY